MWFGVIAAKDCFQSRKNGLDFLLLRVPSEVDSKSDSALIRGTHIYVIGGHRSDLRYLEQMDER